MSSFLVFVAFVFKKNPQGATLLRRVRRAGCGSHPQDDSASGCAAPWRALGPLRGGRRVPVPLAVSRGHRWFPPVQRYKLEAGVCQGSSSSPGNFQSELQPVNLAAHLEIGRAVRVITMFEIGIG